MSLSRMRRWSRLVTAVLLLATACGLPHLDGDDLACLGGAFSGTYEPHDETDHGMRAGDHGDSDHCAVCHWTRLLRAPRPALGAVLDSIVPPSLLERSCAAARLTPALESLPSRAPPAVLL